MGDIPVMTDHNRAIIYGIISDWANRRTGNPKELVADLREAGFPIVTWDTVLERHLEPDPDVTIPRTIIETVCDYLGAPAPDDDGAEAEELRDVLGIFLYPHAHAPQNIDGENHTDLQPPLHLLQGEPHT